ncbi:MAG: hypothetical protein PHC28_10315 [Flavobacterium sp.]|uniref:hypothetical protein n=1 Tax=Flavobacterium sp. TaxID=239 RepID=UPI0026203723|nr:hypothetical protein [Flavobacterium sp.]MDD5150851.1 hypothetical protein [Flavobacterium sp.]
MNIENIAAKTLGDSTSYAIYTDTFNSSLLNPMPRELARSTLPVLMKCFVGYDVWHCYESTFLLNNGMPIAGTLKFVYDSNSEFMIESKSMKLYLNSFDMCKMGSDRKTATQNYINQIKQDLEQVLQTTVHINFFDSLIFDTLNFYSFDNFTDIATLVSDDLLIDDHQSDNNYIEKTNEFNGHFYTNILRSRCRHTRQKDTGSAYLYQYGPEYITPASFIKQVISLREQNEFHEFCAEKLFNQIASKIDNDFYIALLYSRRGSLDINPVRGTSVEKLPQSFIDVNILHTKIQGQ